MNFWGRPFLSMDDSPLARFYYAGLHPRIRQTKTWVFLILPTFTDFWKILHTSLFSILRFKIARNPTSTSIGGLMIRWHGAMRSQPAKQSIVVAVWSAFTISTSKALWWSWSKQKQCKLTYGLVCTALVLAKILSSSFGQMEHQWTTPRVAKGEVKVAKFRPYFITARMVKITIGMDRMWRNGTMSRVMVRASAFAKLKLLGNKPLLLHFMNEINFEALFQFVQ